MDNRATYSPTTRVLTVLELLQTHGRLTGAELARRLAVDGRTLRRYIGKLEDLGIPVQAERGRYGCYALVAGFKLPPMMFTDDEALALSIGLLAARGLGLAQAAPAVQSAQAKLARVMPPKLTRRTQALAETVQLDLAPAQVPDPARALPAADNQALLALSEAAHARQRVQLRYASADGQATLREVDVYGLALRNARWYAVGHCHLRRGMRTFRIDRVQAVEPRLATFTPPRDFDAVKHLALGLATLPRALSVQVLLKTDLATAREQLFETIGLFQPCAQGLMLYSQADDLRWYARQLARLDCDFEVVSPPQLRTALARHATRLLALAAPATAA